MILNQIEKALMNNPIRAFIQRHYEAPMLEYFGGRVDGLRVLEVGCGRGVGTEIIFDRFGAQVVHAYDLDPDMVSRARQRLKRFSSEHLKIAVGDVTNIDEPDESFDAVFDFGIIHHVPNWPDAISEIYRVLKPGGRFFFEEVTNQALNRFFYRTFLKHPTGNRFSREDFISELAHWNISVEGRIKSWFLGDLFTGVGTKQ